MSDSIFNEFTQKHSIQKTLRFELVPIGKTAENIKKKGLLKQDRERAEQYKTVKELIDEYHKAYIEEALKDVDLQGLDTYFELFTDPNKDLKAMQKATDDLRNEVAGFMKDHPIRNEKLLIEEVIPEFLRQQGRNEEAKLVKGFKGFTTYFKGFHENRRNIYSGKEQSTAIAYRLIHENLPKFVSNLLIYQKLKAEYNIDFSEVEKDMHQELNGASLNDVMTIHYFNQCLSQSGIDRYNAIIGGKTDADRKAIQGVNQKINLYRQKHSLTGRQAPVLAPLFKQILSDRTSVSYLPDQFKEPIELIDALVKFYEEDIAGYTPAGETLHVCNEIEQLLKETLGGATVNPSEVYLKGNFLTSVSQQMFGDYAVIPAALNRAIEKNHKTKKDIEAQKKRTYIPLEEIEHALHEYLEVTEIGNTEKQTEVLKQRHPIVEYFSSSSSNIEITKDHKERINVFNNWREKQGAIKEVLKKSFETPAELIMDRKSVARIKDYLDSYLHILHFVKPLYVAPVGKEQTDMLALDNAFYNTFDLSYRQLDSAAIPLYNKTRSFLTKKPYSTEKFKLNFENVTLLSGWDVNKERDNTSIILKKDGLYYLAIMDKRHNKVFSDLPEFNDEAYYEKMNYKLLPGANKMLPKVFFAASNRDEFNPSTEILRIRNHATHSKNGTPQKGHKKSDFNLKDCHQMIDYFKTSILKHKDWKNFGFKFSDTKAYKDLSDFYREVEHQGYKITFTPVADSYINQLVEEGKIYLFKIYNKDFSPHSTGRPNLHTLYWKAVFSDQNLKDVVFKLNGEAEVFYRPASIPEKNKVVHRKGEWIEKKNPLNKDEKSKFEYDIVKDRRYTQDKFHFHVPISLNFKASATTPGRFNEMVNDALKEHTDVNIIGIDRGERHLAYYAVINPEGELLDQGSFNRITNQHKGETHTYDYHNSLHRKEKERDAARKSWDSIGKIKDLKEGYLSQVVHQIARLMVEHNAIVVFEDLNFGFKRGRMKVEKQVYQKLEKMLIDKLNFLAFKEQEPASPGGILNAYQLTAPFESFRSMGKQTGFIFYIPAANTSKIDPVTGFMNLLYPKYENEGKAKAIFEKMDNIRFNPDKGYFEFHVDVNAYRNDKSQPVQHGKWTICTYGKERYAYQPTKRTHQEVDVTKELEELLGSKNIAYRDGHDLKSDVLAVEDAAFFKRLIWMLRLVLQMRYTDGKERDYILSPVADRQGRFFHSDEADDTQPKDADANGAYHIALKGLLQLQKIRNGEKKLAIRKDEWVDFIQTFRS